jgi:hypothetical protein
MSTVPVARPIEHPLLAARSVAHGFGVRGWLGPEGVNRPVQVHGTAVSQLVPERGAWAPAEADALLAGREDGPIAVVTADCVPVLLAAADGARVAAIHAGWRGLAAGVVEATLDAWRSRWGAVEGVAAVIGPHARVCCYEVDAPVRDAFVASDAATAERALVPSRPGHWMIELSRLTRAALARGGLGADRVGEVAGACTICDARRFESFRRDGAAAGRMVHAIAARATWREPGRAPRPGRPPEPAPTSAPEAPDEPA